MLKTALDAQIPIIAVHTDDPVNVLPILQSIAGKKVMQVPGKSAGMLQKALYHTDDMSHVTSEMYKKLVASESQLVVINPDKSNPIMLDAGQLETPEEFIREQLKEFVEEARMPSVLQALKGLSLRAAVDTARLTMARTQALLPSGIRQTRLMLGGSNPGLEPVDTSYDFYVVPSQLQKWLDTNKTYFLSAKVPQKLVPRGLMLVGPAGVGKTSASKVIAKFWDIPCFRLDVSSMLNRYLGESEQRMARNLSIVDQSAPCVLLVDEMEKLFGGQADGDTGSRVMSQLLWWSQEHTSRVILLMTSNNIKIIPQELYRPGRVDKVIEIPALSPSEAKAFAAKVYESVLHVSPPSQHEKELRDLVEASCDEGKTHLPHSEVAELVYDLIKIRNWIVVD